jgi:hypothetical protein
MLHKTSFSLQLMNQSNKLESCTILSWKGLAGTSALAYWICL